jgi:alpha-N-acetylglucosaminidase
MCSMLVHCWDYCSAVVCACMALQLAPAHLFEHVAALALPQALLSGAPRGRLLLLDLFADEHPVWSRTACLYGHPFIWCMLHNFGGNLEMYGALPAVAEGVAAALDAAQGGMVGVGMAPEGIEQNPAVYEFMAEMAFKGRAAEAAAPGGLAAWFAEYAQRRYAGAGAVPASASTAVQGAWQLLARSVYSCRDKLHNTVCDVPTSRPGLSRSEIMGWGLGPHLWYNVGDARAAWELLLQAAAACPHLAGSSSSFVYDLLDVSRELMSKVGRVLPAEHHQVSTSVCHYRLVAVDAVTFGRWAGGSLLPSSPGLQFRLRLWQPALGTCRFVHALLPFKAAVNYWLSCRI